MQKSPEEQLWPPLMRASSGNTRDNKKVSCETLSKVDWYSRRPQEAKLYYHSDGDEEIWCGEGKPASEAEDEHEDDNKDVDEDEDGKEGRVHAGKLESHGYGEGLSVGGHNFSACFASKPVYNKPSAVMSSPGRDYVKKAERVPRTYPSPIPHSGNLLPHSGSLLPHSGSLLPHSGNLLPQSGRLLPHTAGPLKLHVGSHSNTHNNSKPPTSNRLIPSNIGGKSSKAPGGNNVAIEPSSPKVTCLGRVKIKQKYVKEMGKLADVAGTQHSIGDQMKKFRRKKTHEVDAEALPAELSKKGLYEATKVVKISEMEKMRGDEGARANKMGVLISAGNTMELKKSKHGWGSRGEATIMTDAASDSETKGKKGIWRLKEARSHMKFRRDKQKWHPPDPLEAQSSSSQVDSSIDLSRFRSAETEQGQEPRLPKSLASLSNLNGSQPDDIEFVPQVPPPNSLLLMRNSKSGGAACATITISSSSRRHRADLCVHGNTAEEKPEIVPVVDRQGYLSSLREGNFQDISSSSLGVKMEEVETTTMADGHEQTGSFVNLKVKKPMVCSITSQQCKLLQVKMNAMAYGQASLPNVPCEESLWQRRSIMKPSALDVRKPITTR